MSERKQIWAELFKSGEFNGSWLEFREKIDNLVAELPSEFQKNVVIEIEDDGDYDRPRPELSISWWRPEDDVEYAARTLSEAKSAELRDERIKNIKLTQLVNLMNDLKLNEVGRDGLTIKYR